MKRAFLIFALLGGVLFAIGLHGSTPVSIKVNPHVGFAPLHITGYVRIEPNEKNREACVMYVGEDFAAQSCKSLDGVDEPVTTSFESVIPVPGTYEISVVLYRNDGKIIQSNMEHVEVTGGASVPQGGNERIPVSQ